MAVALPFFALTLFVSAFLLFLVQPMIGKMILPRLGGTPQVWNTCMVFFQMALLAGYGYTHFVSTRLKLKQQLVVHGLLLLLTLAVLFSGIILYQPPAPPELPSPETGQPVVAETSQGWSPFYTYIRETFRPVSGSNPIFPTLWILAVVVGLPFFTVATSAPLLQKWFAATGHPAAKDPYFLYGASNLGSFLSLVAYPFFIEPELWLSTQAWTWAVGFGVLALLFFGCVALVSGGPRTSGVAGKDMARPVPDPLPQTTPSEAGIKAGAPPGRRATEFRKGGKHQQFRKHQQPAPAAREAARPSSVLVEQDTTRLGEVTWSRRLRWVALAAVPSSLMLGVTTYITTDLSPIAMLWLIPLMIYLLSFVAVFARWPVVWVGTPHTALVWAQPFALALLVLILNLSTQSIGLEVAVVVHILAFAVTTFVCHGELAKDRPSTEHLTEFYLLMSVGGMLGGMFNGLLAPSIPLAYVFEYPVALFVAGLLRPPIVGADWLDELLGGVFGGAGESREVRRAGAVSANPTVDVLIAAGVLVVTVVLTMVARSMMGPANTREFNLIAFGVPLLFTIALMGQPLRYGLALGAILLVLVGYDVFSERTAFGTRSYFGVIRVNHQPDQGGLLHTSLMHGTTHHGLNYDAPSDPKKVGDPEYDFSRLATTYYHRKGPAGIVMEKFNWFPDSSSDNTFWADARMPAAVAAMGFSPAVGLVNLWSEPPYATIGLGTGTMASYARPFQHMHYYEIDNTILRLSVPRDDSKRPWFTYLRDAQNRGAEVWVMMGDARLRMAQPYGVSEEEAADDHDNAYKIKVIDGQTGGGPEKFYHMMVVDAFSSDAIPVHLLTKEAVQMYFEKLVEDGVLCVHTSNRHVNLVPVVADIAKSLGLVCQRGHDNGPGNDRGHFTSEWVMVARKMDYLTESPARGRPPVLHTPEGYEDKLARDYSSRGIPLSNMEPYWQVPAPSTRPAWTDDYSNLISVLR